jgi:hypothetical protein
MAYNPLVIGDSGQVALDKINNMTAELYSGATVLQKVQNQTANFTVQIPANSYAWKLFLSKVGSGDTSVRVGTTPNGEEILPTIAVNNNNCPGNSTEIPVSTTAYNLYFTVVSGEVNASIFLILNIF